MWKVNKAMLIWGIAFGIAATISGVFLLRALDGGFVAEGFFLLVISWILYIVLISKTLQRFRRRREPNDEL